MNQSSIIQKPCRPCTISTINRTAPSEFLVEWLSSFGINEKMHGKRKENFLENIKQLKIVLNIFMFHFFPHLTTVYVDETYFCVMKIINILCICCDQIVSIRYNQKFSYLLCIYCSSRIFFINIFSIHSERISIMWKKMYIKIQHTKRARKNNIRNIFFLLFDWNDHSETIIGIFFCCFKVQ